ncbi:gamma-glutamylcyclotransferase [Chromohalobacter sp. HP20-39]|uniref:gamma-glutamylcyclotransferase n=1 Tax=Chromohalobacter sp. HP20-39 TaxID=3079306 RepID=UPI00294B4638|nr:gamma-glutamylcyclotransferase [Chromohalobacter sp. HP20-39]MDV6319226.1 hypothetical protein [Chromohalobacter sp. HP20-39]
MFRALIMDEVYVIDAMTFRDLDRLKRYPDWHDRIRFDTPWGEAWCYVMRMLPDTGPLPHGDWHLRE